MLAPDQKHLQAPEVLCDVVAPGGGGPDGHELGWALWPPQLAGVEQAAQQLPHPLPRQPAAQVAHRSALQVGSSVADPDP